MLADTRSIQPVNPAPARQKGATLVVALIILVVLTLLGVTSMQSATLQERMAGNVRDLDIAFQAAEAALREGERLLDDDGFLDMQAGYHSAPEHGQDRIWNQPNFDWYDNADTLAYDDPQDGSARPARFIIEELDISGGGEIGIGDRGPMHEDMDASGMFRITARAVGGSESAVVILQSVYRP